MYKLKDRHVITIFFLKKNIETKYSRKLTFNHVKDAADQWCVLSKKGSAWCVFLSLQWCVPLFF